MNGFVGAVVGGFELAGRLVMGVGAVVEAAVGERAAEPLKIKFAPDSPLEGDGFELSVPRYKRCFLTLPIRWLGAPGYRVDKLRRDGISAIPLWRS